MNTNTVVRLLLVAGVLMLISGFIFSFAQLWIYASLVWIGAFCCIVATLNFKKWNG